MNLLVPPPSHTHTHTHQVTGDSERGQETVTSLREELERAQQDKHEKVGTVSPGHDVIN